MEPVKNILLIDDEPDIVRLLSMSLKSDGYEVSTALNGAEGMKVFDEHVPDVVLTDIKMPGMDGIEVLRTIKARAPDTEVIIITGHGDIDSAIEALQLGASDFINKPVRDEALGVALKRAAERIDIRRQLREYTVDLERKVEAATREIRRHAEFQTKLIRSSNDGVVATDRDLEIVIYNPGAERIFGYRPEDTIDKRSVASLFPQELVSQLMTGLQGDSQFRELPWQEAEIVSKDGDAIPVRFSGTILYEKDQAIGTVGFFRDLREIKRLERELVQSERLAAVGQTTAGLAHCIKNILHGLEGGSYVVDIGLKNSDFDKLRLGWDQVQASIGRTSDLVMDLLYYSKERTPEYAECSPNEIAAEVCDLMAANADTHGIELAREFDADIGRVQMDPQTVYRSLLNLVGNAIDACAMDADDNKHYRVRVATHKEPEQWLRFEVTDNGIGMDEATQANLFTSFFSTKGSQGTGLGLLVSGKLIEEHGGEILVDSRPDAGTTFAIRLPYLVA